MSTAPPPVPVPAPLTVSAIAERHRLHRHEVATLLTAHGIATAWIGPSRVVAEADRPRLERIVSRYLAAKARVRAARP
jgi:hypothetical protein